MAKKIWDREGLALGIATMIFAPSKNKTLSFILYSALTMFKLSLILDPNLLITEKASVKEYDSRYSNTILARDNILVQILKISDIVTYLKFNSSAVLYLFLGISVAWLILCSATLLNYSRFKKWTSNKQDHRPETPFYFKPLTAMIYNYDYFFIIFVNLFILSLTCVKYPSEQTSNATKAGLVKIGEERAAEASTVVMFVRACGLNKKIVCRSLNHYFVCFVASLLMLCNLWIRFCSHLVLSHSPEPSVLMSQYGILGLVHPLLIAGLLAGKSYIMNLEYVSSATINTYLLACIGVLFLDLCIQNLFMPYYSMMINNIRLGESLAMIMIAALVLLIKNTDLHIAQSENFSLVFLCLLFTALFKVALNFQGNQASLKILDSTTGFVSGDISRIAYRGFQYFDQRVTDDRTLDSSQLQTLVFFLNLRRMKQRDNYLKNLNLQELAVNPIADLLKLKMKRSTILRSKNQERAGEEEAWQDEKDKRSQASSDMGSSEHDIHRPAFTRVGGLTLRRDETLKPPQKAEDNLYDEWVAKKSNSLNKNQKNANLKKRTQTIKRQTTLKDKKHRSSIKHTTIMNHQANVLSHKRSDPLKLAERSSKEEKEDENNIDKEFENSLHLLKKQLIINKFKELNDESTKEILFLISEIADECFERLLKSSTTRLATIREVLIISVNLCLNYMGNVPMAMLKLYQTQQIFNRSGSTTSKSGNDYILKPKEERTTVLSNSLRLEIIRAYISLCIRHNSQTSELVLRDIRSKLTSNEQNENNLRLFKLLHFTNTYSELKLQLRESVDKKNNLMNSMAENKTINFEYVYKVSTKFNIAMKKASKALKEVKEIASVHFTGLTLLEGYYLSYLKQDIKRGKSLIKKMMSTGINTNYNNVNFDSLRHYKVEEKVIIGVSGEVLSFHEINFASSNTKLYLSYSSTQLLEKDLSILIPEPLKSKHQNMLSFKDSNGILLEATEMIPVVAIDADDLAVQCRLAVRLNFLVGNGLQFVGALDFSMIDQKDCFVLVDQKGMITNTNFDAYRFLEPNTELSKYDQSFIQSFKEFNKMSDFISRNFTTDVEAMLNDPRIYTHCRTYYNMSLGVEVNIIDKTKKLRQIQYLVNDYYVPRLETCLRTLHFKPGKARMSMAELGNLVINQMASKLSVRYNLNSSSRYDNVDLESQGNASTLLHTLNEDDCLRLAAKIGSEDRRQERVSDILMAIERKLDLLDLVGDPLIQEIKAHRSVEHDSGSSSDQEDDAPREELVPLRSYQKSMELYPNVQMDNAMRFGLYFDLWYKEKVLKIKRTVLKDMNNFKGLFAKKLALNHLKNIAKHAANLKKEHQLAAIMPHTIRHDDKNKIKLSRIILSKLDYKLLNPKTVIFMVLLFLSVCTMFGVGYFKFYLGSLVSTEVRYKLLASDLNSWVVWSTANLILLIDTSRAVYEGYVNNGAYAYWGGAALLGANDQLKRTMSGTLQGVSLQYRHIMQNLSLTAFHDADRFMHFPMVETWNPGNINWNSPSVMPNWTKVNMNTYEAISTFGPLLERYLTRNDSSFTFTKIGLDRDKDLLPEYLRRNLGNDLLKVIMDDGFQIADYFIYICKLNSFLTNYGDLLQLFILLLVATIILVMLLSTRSRMSGFYELLFELRVDFLYIGKRCEDRSRNL